LAALGDYDADVFCGGHTHTQFIRQVGEKVFFNPGSVGAVLFRTPAETRCEPWAEYAILTLENGVFSLDFRRVPFDVRELLKVYEQRKHPLASKAAQDYGLTAAT